jgi:hypothetical protein
MIGAWLLGAAMAAATPQTGNADVDAFVADIVAGRRDAAISRILEQNSLSGQPNAVALVDEFVDKLLRCTFVSSQVRGFGSTMYDIQWRCPDGDYFSLLDPGYRPPRLVVGEFLSADAREARRRRPMLAPPAPVPSRPPAPLSDEEAIQLVTRYLDSVRTGVSAAQGFITFRLHFMDRRQPDSFVSPAQLGRYLAPCRRSGVARRPGGRVSDGNVVVRWACTPGQALAGEITTIMGIYAGQVTAGMVLVGPVPDLPPG